jgi:serine kinase of HPr protein (carbohydrate metabolism regulator)
MTVRDVVQTLSLETLTENAGLDGEITGGYASDLLSDVIANSKAGNLWVTLQTHANVIAVATLKELAAVILVNGRTPDAETLAKAREEKVVVLASRLPAFELVGRLYQAGIRGTV